MPRIADHQLETVLNDLWKIITATGARNDDRVNDEIEVFIEQVILTCYRIELAAQLWVIDQANNNTLHAQSEIDELKKLIQQKVDKVTELNEGKKQ